MHLLYGILKRLNINGLKLFFLKFFNINNSEISIKHNQEPFYYFFFRILNSILVECHYEVRNPHFQCDFSQMYSPMDPNTGLLATRFDIDISDCFSGRFKI